MALTFALFAPVLIGAAGAAYDYSRASALHSDLQQSLDSISQTMTQRINACLDTLRTSNGAGGYTTDNGCLNGSEIGANRRHFNPLQEARTLLASNFTQKGYDPARPPTIIGPVEIDKITGRYAINAEVGYKCVFMSLLVKDCSVSASAGASTSNAFAQAPQLTLTGPAAVEIWAGLAAPGIPFTLQATKGWPSYTYSVGPTMPAGLGLNASTGIVSGIPNAISCSEPCNPQVLPVTTFGVTDSGDQNRGGINKQTTYFNTTFTMIHPLKLSYTGDAVNNVIVSAGKYVYRLNPVRSGGKPGYTYSCSGLPLSNPGNPFTCDPNTGVIKGQPLLTASQPTNAGTITVTIRDARGITANATIPYRFTLPALSGRALMVVRGEIEQDINLDNVFEGSGGWGSLKAICTNLPPGVYCGGTGTDSRFVGLVRGRPRQGSPLDGQFTVKITDDAGQTATFQVQYIWTHDPAKVSEYECGTSETMIAYVDMVYNSVHCKYGCNITRRVHVTCGQNANSNIYAPFAYGSDGPDYGANYKVRIMSKAAMDAAFNRAAGMCDAAYNDLMGPLQGRQGSTCNGDTIFADVTSKGRFVNPTSPPPAPTYCVHWKNDNGWGMTQGYFARCFNGDGSPVS